MAQHFEAVARLRHDWFDLNGFAIAATNGIEWGRKVHFAIANLRRQGLFRQIAIQFLESLSHRCRIRLRDWFTIFELYVNLAHLHHPLRAKRPGFRATRRVRGLQQRPESQGRRRSRRFTIHLILLLQSIGFDRSAFAARPPGAGRQLKSRESSCCSIHAKVFRSFLSKIRITYVTSADSTRSVLSVSSVAKINL